MKATGENAPSRSQGFVNKGGFNDPSELLLPATQVILTPQGALQLRLHLRAQQCAGHPGHIPFPLLGWAGGGRRAALTANQPRPMALWEAPAKAGEAAYVSQSTQEISEKQLQREGLS